MGAHLRPLPPAHWLTCGHMLACIKGMGVVCEMDGDPVAMAVYYLRNAQQKIAMLPSPSMAQVGISKYGGASLRAMDEQTPEGRKLQDAIETLDFLITRMSSEVVPPEAANGGALPGLWPGTSDLQRSLGLQ